MLRDFLHDMTGGLEHGDGSLTFEMDCDCKWEGQSGLRRCSVTGGPKRLL